MRKVIAFTMAEVLITLGIIGVVATMTLPGVIRRYRETVVINQLKKVYAELYQAIQMSEVNNGSFRDWDYTLSNARFAELYIMPYLAKPYTECKLKCFAESTYPKTPANKDFTSVGVKYRYRDKLIAINVNNTQTDSVNDIKYASFLIDINGNRGESIVGKDVFMFTLFNYTYNTGGWVLTPLCPKGEHYGLYLGSIGGYWGAYCGTLDQMFDGGARGDCNVNGNGTSCGLAIEKNGWKIPDNYPIKF